MKRALLAIAVSAACLGAAPAAAAPLPNVVADDLAPPLGGWRVTGARSVRAVSLRDGRGLRLAAPASIAHSLPRGPVALSLDLLPAPGSTAIVDLGASGLRLDTDANGAVTLRAPGLPATALPAAGWATGGWRHLEITGGSTPKLAIDGQELAADLKLTNALGLRATKGSLQATGFLATRRDDRRAALLHRLAELHARVPFGRFPVGIGAVDGLLRFTRDWTDGFWPGMLWLAGDMTGPNAPFADWARAATDRHRGREKDAIHDQGFRYLPSSAAAHDRDCRTAAARGSSYCTRLRQSAYTAADTLVKLAAGNEAVGTIPTFPAGGSCKRCASADESETIVDSMMNLGILGWAWHERGSPQYREVALRHARALEPLLVRADGSTAQSVVASRVDGHVIWTGTRQGYSDTSTWARGQGWAVFGFADTGARFRDRALVAVAERAAAYVDGRLPASGIPPYDYDAPAPAPVDTSAGVITAAGALRLAQACESLSGACKSSAARWRSLGQRMLGASLGRVTRLPPIGMLGDQVYSLGGSSAWDDSGEYAFGLYYALDAIRRSR
ncbi:MAG: unsaturated chondroitin disaccharide hydrolase [Thermoleophilaceae bacterium]|nr:unsaturated chondroitin disaccharide hydrolase [Thermoleophilaceae bacterium]